MRATALWTLLASRTGGTTGTIDTSVAALAPEFASLVGLSEDGDHRRLVAQLLDDLQRRGIIGRRRLRAGSTRLAIRRPPAPSDAAVRRFLKAWKVWRLTDPDGCGERHREAMAIAATHLHHHVREPWAALLEAGRLSVRVLPGAGPA